jgi:hypothetical protein
MGAQRHRGGLAHVLRVRLLGHIRECERDGAVVVLDVRQRCLHRARRAEGTRGGAPASHVRVAECLRRSMGERIRISAQKKSGTSSMETWPPRSAVLQSRRPRYAPRPRPAAASAELELESVRDGAPASALTSLCALAINDFGGRYIAAPETDCPLA